MSHKNKKHVTITVSLQLMGVKISCTMYNVMMIAYPSPFRQRFGEDMRYVFREMCRDAVREYGWWGMLGVWIHTLLDLATTAIKERLLVIGYRRAIMIDTTEFDSQIISSVQYMSRRLRSGYSVLQCFETLAERAPEPTASQFRQAATDWKAGKDIEGVMGDLMQRVPSDALRQVIETLNIQRQEGGNLADRFDLLQPMLEQKLGKGQHWSSDLPDNN